MKVKATALATLALASSGTAESTEKKDGYVFDPKNGGLVFRRDGKVEQGPSAGLRGTHTAPRRRLEGG